MPHDLESVETILSLLKQMEDTLLGLQQLRLYVGKGIGQQMLEVLIEEAETQIAEVRRKLMQ
jgi:hypothetical protein